jgi:hypothetical protein
MSTEIEVLKNDLGIPIGLTASDTDNAETAARILTEIATAADADEVFGADVIGLDDFDGQVVGLLDFAYQPSTIEPGPDESGPVWPYAVIDLVTVDGEKVKATSGAKKVIVQLATWRKLKALPTKTALPVKVKVTDLGGGKSVTAFERPETKGAKRKS